MSIYFGIDTSNYTTSMALYDTDTQRITMTKKLLPVAEGAKGLRQSDAVFAHIKQLTEQAEDWLSKQTVTSLQGIGVSGMPRRVAGSYMPCFLVGKMTATVLSSLLKIPCLEFSHQEGHVAAALYAADSLDWLSRDFYAFHVSGGTTEVLSVTPKAGTPSFAIEKLFGTLDLNAGQVIDRVGVMLGLSFPCGSALEALADTWEAPVKGASCVKEGNCCLSGLENRCERLLAQGKEPAYVAAFCLASVEKTLVEMIQYLWQSHGEKPLLYAGGVMSNRKLQSTMYQSFGGIFAPPAFSSDNSAGIAVLAAMHLETQKENHQIEAK